MVKKASLQQLADQVEKHFDLLQDNMSLCIKYFAMWEIAWRDESLAEKLNNSSAGTGFVTLRSMASDSLLSAVVRMFEPDTKAKQSVWTCPEKVESERVVMRPS